MSLRRTGSIAAFCALVVSASLAAPTLAAPTALPGNPLTVYVGERGQLQAFRAGIESGIFFAPSNTLGDAGFFLAFPNASPPALTGKVFGFDGSAGPNLEEYTPLTQGAVTGSGTASDPFVQVTTYAVAPAAGPNLAEVTHTTTYVNGTQQFGLRWDVKNVSGASVTFKALAAADFFFDGSDRGTGIFTDGPPRFIGGTNADTGNSGGFAEVSSTPAWSAYQALAWGGAAEEVWGKVQNSAQSTAATFDNSVVGESVDNAGGVEWDQFVSTPVPNGETRSFELTARSAVPSALQLTPPNAGSPKGVPVNFSATATNTDGVPYAGRTLRYRITGVNPGTGSVVLSASGTGTITDPGTNAGNDTVVAFVDFNNDGAREPAEPQASALATFVDNVAPSCTVKVSGDRPGGGGAGKPLVITVNCNEPATVTTSTTLQTIPGAGAASAKADAAAKKKRKKKKPVKIKLKPTTSTVAPGQAVPIKIAIPRKVARKYAGKTLKATVTVTAKDSAGNAKQVKATKKIKLAKIKKKRRRR